MNLNYINLILICQVLISCNISLKTNNDYLPSQITETITLLGDTLRSPKLKEGKSLNQYKLAQKSYFKDLNNPELLIWYGRRTAYLGYYQEAINLFSKGIGKHPNDPRFYRHRGHRYISTRQYEKAIQDFQLRHSTNQNQILVLAEVVKISACYPLLFPTIFIKPPV